MFFLVGDLLIGFPNRSASLVFRISYIFKESQPSMHKKILDYAYHHKKSKNETL